MTDNYDKVEQVKEPPIIEAQPVASPKSKALSTPAIIAIVISVLIFIGGLCGACGVLGYIIIRKPASIAQKQPPTPDQKVNQPRFPATEAKPLPLDATYTKDNLTIKYPSSWTVEDWLGTTGGFIISAPGTDLLIFGSNDAEPVNLASKTQIASFDRYVTEDFRNTIETFSALQTSEPIRYTNEGTIVSSIRFELSIDATRSLGFLTLGTDGKFIYNVYSHVAKNSTPELMATLQAVVESITLTKPKPVVSKPLVGKLVVHFIDVGEGDSSFIELPNKKTLLIDAGSESAGPSVVASIKKLGYSSIDYLVVSNAREEHVGGVPTVLEAFTVGEVWAPDMAESTKAFDSFLKVIKAKGMTLHAAQTGSQITAADNLTIDVLAPMPETADHTFEDHGFSYDYQGLSAIIEVTFGENTFLFTGDTSHVLTNNAVFGSRNRPDVLKVGNHGSDAATDDDLIKFLDPSYAVISVGPNKDGFPAGSVLKALSGVNTYRTDTQGTIIIAANGKRITVNVEK